MSGCGTAWIRLRREPSAAPSVVARVSAAACLVLSALARLSRSGRRPSGLVRYWVIGGVYLQQQHVTVEGDLIDRDPVKSFQVGYGWDWKPKRVRNGLEISAFLAGPHIGAVRYYVMWD